MRTLVALFDDFNVARDVVEDLVETGFERAQISLMANDVRGEYARWLETDTGTTAAEGAGFGVVVGALTGLGALLIPGGWRSDGRYCRRIDGFGDSRRRSEFLCRRAAARRGAGDGACP